MKKKHWLPDEYRQKAIAAIIVIAAGVAIFMVAQRLGYIVSFLGDLLSAMQSVLIGIGIAYLLSPVLRRIETLLNEKVFRKKPHPRISRAVGVIVSEILLLVGATLFLLIVTPQLYQSINSVIRLAVRFINSHSDAVNEVLEKFGVVTVDGDDLIVAWEQVLNQAKNYIDPIFSNALSLTSGAFSLVMNLLVAVAVSVYALFEKEKFGAQVKKVIFAFFPRETCVALVYWMRRSNRIFAGFISGKIYDSIIMGLLCYVCMRLFGMEYPALISCVFGVTNVVPFFGPIVGGVIGTVLLLIVNPRTAIWFAVLALVLQQLDGNVIGPHILGETIGLSAFWIMLAIVISGGLFGFTGMLLGAPVFAILYAIFRAVIHFRLSRKGLPLDDLSYYGVPNFGQAREDKEDT